MFSYVLGEAEPRLFFVRTRCVCVRACVCERIVVSRSERQDGVKSQSRLLVLTVGAMTDGVEESERENVHAHRMDGFNRAALSSSLLM